MQLARHREQIEAEITQIGNLSLRRAVALIKTPKQWSSNDENESPAAASRTLGASPGAPPDNSSITAVLDRIGVDGMLEVASAEFKQQLGAKLPGNPSAWLAEKVAETIAKMIVEKAGKSKAAAIRNNLPILSALRSV